MKFSLIDYSHEFYGDKMPPERRGKFIQVRNKSREYLVLAPRELCQFHANIAERFFNTQGIKGSYNAKHDSFRVDHPDWSIVGGGQWCADEAERRFVISGESLAYGRYDHRGLARRLQKSNGFVDYIVEVSK